MKRCDRTIDVGDLIITTTRTMTTNKQEYIENLTGDKNKAAATFYEATTKLIQAEDAIRIELAKLDVKKKNIEHEADAVFLELTTPPAEGVDPMGIDTPLVDGDGYPRGDIDLYRCRILRHRFRELKTDHHETSSAIESMLVQLSALKVCGRWK
jgi:Nas2 N_terminal domain